MIDDFQYEAIGIDYVDESEVHDTVTLPQSRSCNLVPAIA